MPVTPAAQNELEKLDMLLSKLDAVRYALSEVLDFFVTSGVGSSDTDSAHGTIQDYRHRVQRTERSLQELQRSSATLAGMSQQKKHDRQWEDVAATC